MVTFSQTPRAPGFDFTRAIPQEAVEAEYDGKQPPSEEAFQEFQFEQTIIPLEGGSQRLRLQRPLMLRINPSTLRFTVKDWGIEMDCLELPRLPREVARKFLVLLDAAENERLNETEQADLLRISDYVDFQQFSIDRSAPRYMEGTLRGDASVPIVEWHDGSRETLDRSTARALSEVNPGERFSAFVKLGKDDKAIAMERVSILATPAEKEDWNSWPKKS